MSNQNKELPGMINLTNLFSSKGKNLTNWQLFLKDINNEIYSEAIVSFLKSQILQNPQNSLTLDVVDFIIDNGCPKIINLIAQNDFFNTFLNLLKIETNAGKENQKKVIYLTQRWAKKFSNISNYPIFLQKYNLLKNKGIFFPPDNYVMNTYNKYFDIKDNNCQQNGNLNNQNNDDDFCLFKDENNNNRNNNMEYNNNRNNNINSNNNYNINKNNTNNNFNNNNNNNSNNNFNNNFNKNLNNNYNYNNNSNNNYNNKSNNNNINSINYNNNPSNSNNNKSNNNKNPYNNNNNQINNNINNNNINNISNNRISQVETLCNNWKKKLRTYNQLIDEGNYMTHDRKLDEGIKEILDILPSIDKIIDKCEEKGENDIKTNLLNIKSDMEQTCYRFEFLIKGKIVEPFISAFYGNRRKYTFNKNTILEKEFLHL